VDDLIPSASHEIRFSIHHPHPLVVEECARNCLFGAESTTAMLVLARDMRAHSFYLREATRLEPHMERAWAKGIRYQAEPEHKEFFRLLRLYAQAARMVQLSEVSIVVGCERVLEGISWEVARPGTEFRRALGRASVPRAAYHTRTTPATAVRGGRRGFPRAAGAANGPCCGPGGLVAGCAGTTDESENHGVPGSNPGPATKESPANNKKMKSSGSAAEAL
jgi:hypothetical protein